MKTPLQRLNQNVNKAKVVLPISSLNPDSLEENMFGEMEKPIFIQTNEDLSKSPPKQIPNKVVHASELGKVYSKVSDSKTIKRNLGKLKEEEKVKKLKTCIL